MSEINIQKVYMSKLLFFIKEKNTLSFPLLVAVVVLVNGAECLGVLKCRT